VQVCDYDLIGGGDPIGKIKLGWSQNKVHCKKRFSGIQVFLSPAGMSLTKLSWLEMIYPVPVAGRFGKKIQESLYKKIYSVDY